ncbi:site-2 protease family protein [Qipengyuania atrilutea]|uniref:Site-2 protease family protein n=1 Tax=Qipengyuania atrilutea TaxID=2744473 RepID=A0A850H8P0_9SPHN|nr:site-2 protease family protein [Actirhodobacter atriluteus]NVD43459.1 site-2 protease family protein [Actirhodobacter atriluteus]
MTDTLSLALILIPCLIVAIVFHEVAHGWTALALGDPTAKERRRLTLNPIRHVDPVGTLLVPGLLALAKGPVFGWAKPVPVIKERLRNPRFGMVLVAAAGPGINFVMALAASVLLGFVLRSFSADTDTVSVYLSTGLQFFILINIFIGLFNLLPIPPFDGSHIVEGLLPPSLARKYEKLRPFGMVLFFALVAVTWFAPEWGVIENTILPPVLWLESFFMGIAGSIAG